MRMSCKGLTFAGALALGLAGCGAADEPGDPIAGLGESVGLEQGRGTEPASPCRLLDDEQVMGLISGPAEVALKEKCGLLERDTAPGKGGGIEAEFGPDVLVNNKATDTWPNITQSETSIAVYQNQVLGGWNDSSQFSTLGDFTGYGTSDEWGDTWTDRNAPTTPLGTIFRVVGDPVVQADRPRVAGQTGVFYFANLANVGSASGTSVISVHKTINGGVSWASAVNASPLAVAGQTQDKEWMAVDTRAAGLAGAGNIYVCWTRFGGAGGIQFSRSTNGGASFTQLAANLSSAATNVQGCSVAVGPAGQVYVAWSDFNAPTQRIRFRRSLDFGVTFQPEITVGNITPAENSTQCGRPVFVDSEANFAQRAIRSRAFPSIAVSLAGATSGQIYVVWHSIIAGGSLADIVLSRSTDNGVTFSAPVRVNNTSTGLQFFPAVATNSAGQLMVMYYSTQNSATNRRIDVYTVRSTGGVPPFPAPVKVTTTNFDRPVTNPNFDTLVAGCYMGDYNGITAAAPGLGTAGDTSFYLLWGDNRKDGNASLAGLQPDPDIRFDKDPI